jgi:hypothetical protein
LAAVPVSTKKASSSHPKVSFNISTARVDHSSSPYPGVVPRLAIARVSMTLSEAPV